MHNLRLLIPFYNSDTFKKRRQIFLCIILILSKRGDSKVQSCLCPITVVLLSSVHLRSTEVKAVCATVIYRAVCDGHYMLIGEVHVLYIGPVSSL